MKKDVLQHFFLHILLWVMKMWSMEYMVLYHCAPVLMEIRSGCTITINRSGYREFAVIMEAWNADYIILSAEQDKMIILVYCIELLRRRLALDEGRKFLDGFGYKEYDCPSCFEKIKDRYGLYRNGVTGFPHEIGFFLDYPIEDMKLFIKNEGKNYIFCGYWKVYQCLEQARLTFREYDEAKDIVMGKALINTSGHKL